MIKKEKFDHGVKGGYRKPGAGFETILGKGYRYECFYKRMNTFISIALNPVSIDFIKDVKKP